jgi:carbamate kinase
MGPKVEAAAWFVRETGGRAGIGSLAEARAVLAGRSGTTVSPSSDGEVGRLDQVA